MASPRSTADHPTADHRTRSAAERRRVLETVTGVPATEGNLVEVLRDGDEIFPAMLDAIRAADHSVDFMTFVWWRGEVTERFVEAFCDRARDGLRVRVLLDGFGSLKMDRAQRDRMHEAGVQVHVFRDLATWKVWQVNMRTHRRALVCDGRVAFTGGVGIAQEWADGGAEEVPAWRETHFRVTGPAVAGIHSSFLCNWMETHHRTVHDGERFPEQRAAGDSVVQVLRATSQLGWNDMAMALLSLTEIAEERIRITSAYFRPPATIRRALADAAARGVEVEVLVPGRHAEPVHYRLCGQHHYAELLDAGIRIHHYDRTMLHAKLVTVDGQLAFTGTTNVDARSIAINEQVGLLLHDPAVVAVLDEHFDEDLRHARTIDADDWRRRPLSQRVLERTAHTLTFPLRGAGAVD